jgi:hypothetical protein
MAEGVATSDEERTDEAGRVGWDGSDVDSEVAEALLRSERSERIVRKSKETLTKM